MVASIQDHPYFFWGSANPDQYGLYSSTLDRFLLVDSTAKNLDLVGFLMYSKISLTVVPISSAPNFQHNLIDNTCCLHWGVSDWTVPSSKLLPNYFHEYEDYNIDICGRLVQRSEIDLDQFNELQRLIMAVKHAVDFFRTHPNSFYTRFYDLVSVPIDNFAYVKQQEKKCFDLLYRAQSFDEIADEISNILDDKLIADKLTF